MIKVKYILLIITLINQSNYFSQNYSDYCNFKNGEKLIIYEDIYKVTTNRIKDYANWNDSIVQVIQTYVANFDSVIIFVHTDVRGSNDINIKTSQAIASKIATRLNFQYPSKILLPIGLGENFPLIQYEVIKKEEDKIIKEKYHNINSRVEFIGFMK